MLCPLIPILLEFNMRKCVWYQSIKEEKSLGFIKGVAAFGGEQILPASRVVHPTRVAGDMVIALLE